MNGVAAWLDTKLAFSSTGSAYAHYVTLISKPDFRTKLHVTRFKPNPERFKRLVDINQCLVVGVNAWCKLG